MTFCEIIVIWDANYVALLYQWLKLLEAQLEF